MQDTAILVFTRSPQEELGEKSLVKFNRHQNANLIRLLNDKLNKTAQNTNYPVFQTAHIKECSFIEKYQRAFKELFEIGYSKVLCFGNDIPEISTNKILELSSDLDTVDLVTAPTNRGGIAFLGLTLKGFESFRFNQLPWQTEKLYEELLKHVTKTRITSFIEPNVFIELNTQRDLEKFLYQLEKVKHDPLFLENFRAIFLKKNEYAHYIESTDQKANLSNQNLRAP